MFNGRHWVIKYHPWASPPHHLTYAGLHLRFVAVDGTLPASGFAVGKAAMVEPRHGIAQQLIARCAQSLIALLMTAIQTYHKLHHSLFISQSAHIYYAKVRKRVKSEERRVKNQCAEGVKNEE